MKGKEQLYIVDTILPLPGTAAAVHRHYVEAYVPAACSRGLELRHAWVSPPVWLEGDQCNTLTFVWSVIGTAAYWEAEGKARWDATTPEFWRSLEPMIQSRTRRVMAEADDIAGLCDV